MKKYLLYIGIGVLTWGSTGCDDFLDQYSQDLVIAKSVQDLNELLIGDVYLRSYTVDKGMSQRPYAFVNMLDDDINTTGTSQKGNIADIAWTNVLAPMFGYFAWQQDVRYNFGATTQNEDNATWNTLYTRITHANNIIDIIDEMPRHTDEEKALYHRVKGEAHFVRGQFYLALANLYGKAYDPDSAATDLCVPLKLTPHVEHDKTKETQFERASVEAVFNQIAQDLMVAEEQLSLSPQPKRFRLHRASAEAASLLLSRVYLNMQQWEKAEISARKVMNSPNFSLATIAELQSGQPFLTKASAANEVIFSQSANHIAAKDDRTSLSGAWGDYCVTRDLYDSYDDNDARKTAFFAVNALSDSIRLTNKYERGLELNHISDAFTLRMAEAYLNYAEACVMQKNKDAEANAALTELRLQRIASYETTSYSGEELAAEIRKERRRELCFEGHRWFDLRRYAVNKVYPFSKDIVHAFNAYSDANSFVATHIYVLPAGDPSYTFAIPYKAIEFDKTPMINNLREKRPEVKPELPLPPTFDDEDEEAPNDSTDVEP